MHKSLAQDIQTLMLQQNQTMQLVYALQAQANITDQETKTLQLKQQVQLNSSTQEIRAIQQQQQQDLQACKSDVLHLQETLNRTIDHFNFKIALLQANISFKENELPNSINASGMCGGPGWRRVAFINMSDSNQNCPRGLNLTDYSIRSCGRAENTRRTCSSVTFLTNSSLSQYSQVCGRATAYRWGYNYAFNGYHSASQNIDGYYVDGLSLTHGSPRTHIWTFASGLFNGTNINDTLPTLRCPCNPGNSFSSPPFVGNDCFCESVTSRDTWNGKLALFPENPLWTGQGCGQNNSPWFKKTLLNPTSDNIEVRLCTYEDRAHTDIALELLEIYVH